MRFGVGYAPATPLNGAVRTVFEYPDADDDGYVDGTIPPMRQENLCVYCYDTVDSVWKLAPSGPVDTALKRVAADVSTLGTCALLAGPNAVRDWSLYE